MATAEQLKALIRCHAEGDNARFYAIAMQVAAAEARNGHGRFAIHLPPGAYDLTVVAAGFKKYARSGIAVSPETAPPIEIALEKDAPAGLRNE